MSVQVYARSGVCMSWLILTGIQDAIGIHDIALSNALGIALGTAHAEKLDVVEISFDLVWKNSSPKAQIQILRTSQHVQIRPSSGDCMS